MGTLYLVRHGQASLGAEDYDHLSPLGRQQSVRLGEYFRQKGLHFETVLTGTLRRQVQTYAGICEGMGCVGASLLWPGLNEFDSAALITTSAVTTPNSASSHAVPGTLPTWKLASVRAP